MKRTFLARIADRDIALSHTGGGDFIVDGTSAAVDIRRLDDNRLLLRIGGQGFEAVCVAHSPADRTVTLLLNGRTVCVQLNDEKALLLQRFESEGKRKLHSAHITAPMPGKVVKVLVSTGERIEAGDGILILEAMKMENEIRAPGAGIVKSIRCREQDAVEKGALLVEIGD